MKELWFKAKLYGWGWYPSSWQGLTITFIAIIIYLFSFFKIMNGVNVTLNIIIIAIDFILLILICYKTGEKPRWRWGK